MTPELGRDAAPTAHGWIAFYQLQARLMWEWRPTRLAILRRATLSFLGACLALAITAGVVPGLQVDGLAPLLLACLILLALDSTLAVVLHGLLVGMPIFVAQLLGVVAQFGAIVAIGRLLPGIHVGDTAAAVWGAIFLTVLNSLFAELVAVSDDDSYYSVLVRRLVAREFRHPKETQAGFLVVQIDGVSLPVLREAIRAGRVPVLGRLVRSGEATLHAWIAMLPPTTPASQGGILHGNNDGIAGFRWYEKATGKLLVANHPEDAAEIVDRISNGRGLLANDGAGIGNLVTGDAPRSYLTMATIDTKAPSDDARRLRGFFVTTVNYIRLLVLMAGEVAQAVVDDTAQVIVAIDPGTDGTDTRQLPAMLDGVRANTGRYPKRLLADAGYASDENLAELDSRGIDAYVAVRRERHSAPPAPAPRGRIPKGLSRRERMARKLRTKAGRAHYARRKVIVEPRLRPDQGARRLPAVPPAGQTEGERRVAAGVCRPQPGQALPERPRWAGHRRLGPISGPGRWQDGPRMGLMGTNGAPSDPSTRPAACHRLRPARGALCARKSAPGITPRRRRTRAISNAAT